MNCFSTIPYITFLGFTLLLIIGITIFLIRRMNNQNQKFSSIIGVVTTMADELNKIKSYISNGFTSKPSDVKEIHLQNILIHVSEDEDDDEDNDEEDDEENDEEDDDEDNDEEDDDEENDEEDDDEDDDHQHDDDDVIKDNIIINEKTDDIKYIQIDAKEDFNYEENINIQGSIKEDTIQEVTIQEDTIQEDTIQEDTPQEDTPQEDTTQEDTTQEKVDYKKLPLQKLRSIVSKKRLVDDSSKMKKNELLQLLEKE